MRSCFRLTRTLGDHISRLSILALLLASTVAFADPRTLAAPDNDIVTYNVQDRASRPAAQVSRSVLVAPVSGGGGAVSYWLLGFLLVVNIAGVVHMRRWAETVESRDDKE